MIEHVLHRTRRRAGHALTEQRLLETYGELITQAGVERAANEAVHNDARARFVATELATMQRAMSVKEKQEICRVRWKFAAVVSR